MPRFFAKSEFCFPATMKVCEAMLYRLQFVRSCYIDFKFHETQLSSFQNKTQNLPGMVLERAYSDKEERSTSASSVPSFYFLSADLLFCCCLMDSPPVCCLEKKISLSLDASLALLSKLEFVYKHAYTYIHTYMRKSKTQKNRNLLPYTSFCFCYNL